jgi:hypothetical protein
VSRIEGFVCSSCGQFHEGLPMDFAFDEPIYAHALSPEEKETRCELTPDWCVIDNEHFFVRGRLEIPVIDGPRSFVWGLWTSLSEKNFKRTQELWNVAGRENEPPYFGWLSNSVPGYPETLNLKTRAHTRAVGERPFIELEPTDHPLAVEQREGITMARVQQIAERLLHYA